MTKTATLDVQLIGYTVFNPPIDRKTGEPLFIPDRENAVIDDHCGKLFDGEALAEFAGRACYQSFHRPNAKTATNRSYLANTQRQRHGSIEEHGSVSFWITGISRTCSHEIVRHRHFSYSQLSQRYVDSNGVEIVLPPELLVYGPEEGEVWEAIANANDAVRQAYQEIQEALTRVGLGKKRANQAARSMLLNATETRMVMTGNYRAWKGFLTQRDSDAADPEIRKLAQHIGNKLAAHAPNLFDRDARVLWDTSDEHGKAVEIQAEFPAAVE